MTSLGKNRSVYSNYGFDGFFVQERLSHATICRDNAQKPFGFPSFLKFWISVGKQLGNSRKSSLVGASAFFLKGLFEKGLSRPPPGRITSLIRSMRMAALSRVKRLREARARVSLMHSVAARGRVRFSCGRWTDLFPFQNSLPKIL